MSNINVIDKIKIKVGAWALKDVQNSDLSERFKRWFSPHNIYTRQSSNILANNETIFAAVSRLSNSLGSLPLKLLDKEYRQVYDHIAAELIIQPNPNMTGYDFIRTMEAIRDTEGNAYAMKEYDATYQPKALWILDPNKVKEVIEEDSKELWYEIEGHKGRYYVHNMDIIHVKHIHGYGYRGISPLKVLTNTRDYDAKVRNFSLKQIDSAITASFILKMASHVNDKSKESTLESFRRFYQDNGGVLIQEQGTEITDIGQRNFIDTKIFETEKITRTRVASVYNMPPHMLGEVENTNYSTMEQMTLEFVQMTMVPIARQYEMEFNQKILTASDRRKGLYFKFNLNALLRGDMKTRGDFYFKGVRSGLFKPNEIRAWEDLPPDKNGDKLYVSGDLYPIDQPRQKGGSK